MSKQALCVEKQALSETYRQFYENRTRGFVPLPPGIGLPFNWTMLSMVDRPGCETNNDYLQIIPYIVVRSGPNTLRYSRGKAGDENRLHAKLSIGFGGHMDTMVPLGQTTKGHILEEAARELKEELGFDAEVSDIKIVGFIAEGETEVGQVHLGVLCVTELPADHKLYLEENIIETLEICSVERIMAEYASLEIWSQIAIHSLPESTVPPNEDQNQLNT